MVGVLKPALHTCGLTTAINFESQNALWQNVEEGQTGRGSSREPMGVFCRRPECKMEEEKEERKGQAGCVCRRERRHCSQTDWSQDLTLVTY